jgi:tripartite-type tricarboxylate transporter receptor subunit TctC
LWSIRLIQAGRIRSLVFFSPNRAPNFPDVPTTEEATGHKWHKGVWRGFAAPKGLPQEIATQYETAIKKVWDSAESKEFMNRRGFDMIYLDSLLQFPTLHSCVVVPLSAFGPGYVKTRLSQ